MGEILFTSIVFFKRQLKIKMPVIESAVADALDDVPIAHVKRRVKIKMPVIKSAVTDALHEMLDVHERDKISILRTLETKTS